MIGKYFEYLKYYRTKVEKSKIRWHFCKPVPALFRYTAKPIAPGAHSRDTAINNRAIFGTLCAAFVFYSTYVYTKGTEASHVAPISAAARHGQQVFQEYNCIACHQFYGLGGYMGPDLTNVISNRGELYARAFIASGTATMPNLGLADNEIDAVIAYLAFVDQTGTYPAENYDVQWYGTVAQEDDPR